MLMDKELIFSEAQAPGNIATVASTNYLDRGVDSDWGKGELMWLVVLITETTAGASSTMDIQFVTDDEVTFTSPTVIWSTGALGHVAATTAGFMYRIRVPSGLKQFARMNYVVAGGNQSAGKVTSFLTRDVDDYKTYPRADYKVA